MGKSIARNVLNSRAFKILISTLKRKSGALRLKICFFLIIEVSCKNDVVSVQACCYDLSVHVLNTEINF